MPVVGLGSALLLTRNLVALKPRIPDRRTAYLRFPQPPNGYRILFILIFFAANAITTRLANAFPGVRPWLEASFLVLPAISLFGIGVQTGLARFFHLAVVTPVASTAILLSESPPWPAYLVLPATFGTAFLVSASPALSARTDKPPARS